MAAMGTSLCKNNRTATPPNPMKIGAPNTSANIIPMIPTNRKKDEDPIAPKLSTNPLISCSKKGKFIKESGTTFIRIKLTPIINSIIIITIMEVRNNLSIRL